jgi:multiple sugar transport system ATP-binding protein
MTGTGVERVTVVRGGTTVLRDVTLQAADGELLVVLGASGSGKSTLLRVLAGLDQVSSGEVLIKGRQVTGLPSGERRVAMVFQASTLIPFLDVSRNLGWGLRVQRRPEAEVKERVSGRVRQLRLSRLLSRRPGELSGGERGLVGIGRALVQIPDVFLLDEPLGDLDAVQRTEVRRQIVEVVRSLGVTTLYVTHDQAEGLAVADRVALLHEGGVVQVGRPRELYDRPVDLFVAGFVGAPPIGLLSARLVSAGGQAGFAVGARTLPLWQAVPPPLLDHVGREVVLGLRAEDVHGAQAGHGPNSVTLDAVVRGVEYTGRQNVVTLEVAAPRVVAPGSELSAGSSSGVTLRSFFPPRAVLRPGNAVQVAVDATRAHVFDAVTGRALWHAEDARDGDAAADDPPGPGDDGDDAGRRGL